MTAHIYEKCRRPKATKKAKTKTSKISKTSVFHRFFIFEVLVSFPQVEMGRKPKPPISKTSQKPLLKNLSVFDFFGFGVGFDVDNFRIPSPTSLFFPVECTLPTTAFYSPMVSMMLLSKHNNILISASLEILNNREFRVPS